MPRKMTGETLAALFYAVAGMNVGAAGLSDPRGLDDPYYRWNAECVRVAAPFASEDFRENEYASAKYGKIWNFDDNNFEGISRFSEGIKNPKIKDGKLCFTTGEDPFFYWGDHYKGDNVKGEDIGFNWRDKAFMGLPWKVLIRLKQNKPEAVWRVSSLAGGTSGKVVSTEAAVKGDAWQTVAFDMGKAWVKNTPTRFCSLAIEPGGADNSVEIDWLKIVAPQRFRYLRKTVTLSDAAKSASFCLIPVGQYAFYVNGEKVASGTGTGIRRAYYEVDCGKYFKKGTNVIAYEESFVPDYNGQYALLEGVVKLTNGDFERIYTDASWKGSYAFCQGWELPGYDDASWKPVKSDGNLVKHEISGKKLYKNGVFCRFVTPPYFGPIAIAEIGAISPRIFKRETGISLRVALPIKTDKNAYDLTYKLVDAFTDKTVVSGTLTNPKESAGDYEYVFDYKPEKPGVYNFVVDAKENGKILDRHFYELAAVGKIPQREVGLDDIDKETKSRLVETIRCGDPNDPHAFIDGEHSVGQPGEEIGKKLNLKRGNSRTVMIGGESFRETNNRWASWFSYRIKIAKPRTPHMIEVAYLDDRECAFEARVTEKRQMEYGPCHTCRNTTAVAAGGPLCPSTGKIQTLKLMYYPRTADATVDILNLLSETRPAIARINVYEVLDMPAAWVPNPSGRLFGSHLEHHSIELENFYDGELGDLFANGIGTGLHYFHGALKEWYLTYENQIKYMRFSGENLAFTGFWMYYNAFYPSAIDSHPFHSPVYDHARLMFDMFAANGLCIVPCVEFMGKISNNLGAMDNATNSEVSNGAATVAQVDKDGRQAVDCQGNPMLSPINPIVVEEAARIVRELAERYGYSKAFKGVGVIPGWTNFWPDFGCGAPKKLEDLLDCDYSDYAIFRFEKETGINIPVAADDRERFQKRYDWIMKNAQKQWIDFRNRAMADTHLKLRDALNQVKPNAQYYLFYMPNLQVALPEFEAKTKSPREIFRYMSMDPELYKNQQNMNYGLTYLSDHFYTINGSKPKGVLRDFFTSDEMYTMFDMGDNSAAHVREGFNETLIIPPAEWLWKWSDGNPVYYLAHRYFAMNFVSRLRKNTPTMMTFAWQDIVMNIGYQDRIRTFGVPFQSIPMGEYANLSENGSDKNIVIRLSKNGDNVNFYVVNPYWWDIDVRIGLSEKTEVLDLVTNVRTDTDMLTFSMKSYEVKVFQLERGGALSRVFDSGPAPVSASTEISAEGKQFADGLYALSLNIARDVNAALLRRTRILDAEADIKRDLSDAQAAYRSGDYYRFVRAMEKAPILKLRSYFEAKRNAVGAARSEYRIDIGADTPYTDASGRVWGPDQDYKFGANLYGYVGGNSFDRALRGHIEIKGSDTPRIYETERSNLDAYGFKVPNGKYEVKLHYVEAYKYRPEEKVTDCGVAINGEKAFAAFNLGEEAGGFEKALVKTVKNVTVTNGEIYVEFDKRPGSRLNAIEVIKTNP